MLQYNTGPTAIEGSGKHTYNSYPLLRFFFSGISSRDKWPKNAPFREKMGRHMRLPCAIEWGGAAPHRSVHPISKYICYTWGAVVVQWIRPRTLSREVPGSNLLTAAVVPLGKAFYPHRLVPWTGLKAVGPLVLAYRKLAFFVAR